MFLIALYIGKLFWRFHFAPGDPFFRGYTTTSPEFVYDAFYPQGWQQRQLSDLEEVLDQEPQNVSVALEGECPVGWVCTRIHPEDQMGEIYVIAVDPEYQRRGVGQQLMEHAYAQIKDAGMRMVMVETGGDSGHAPAPSAL